MKTLLLFVFVLCYSIASAQLDTLIVKRNIAHGNDDPQYKTEIFVDDGNMANPPFLVGTTILPNTLNQLGLKNFNLVLSDVRFQPCNSEPPVFEWDPDDTTASDTNKIEYEISDFYRIESVSLSDSGLSVDIKIWENCCHFFLCDARVVEDSVLSLFYYSYGKYICDCDCCFGLTYVFSFMGGQEEEFKKIKYVMIEDMDKTKVLLLPN